MAQNQRRMIYTKLWTSQQFRKLSDRAKLLYVGMITLADDDGRLIADPSYLRGQIFTYDDISIADVLELRNSVENQNLITVYKIEQDEYLEHPNWEEYQVIRPDLYKPSTLPSRNGHVTRALRKSATSKDKISKDKIINNTDDFQSFWKIYPKKTGKKKTEELWNKLTNEIKAKILEDIPKRLKDEKWIAGFIKDPERYIKHEQWEDEILYTKKLINDDIGVIDLTNPKK